MIGDHIRTLKAGRWTHAIDCGDETVLALLDEAGRPPRVGRSYRPEFVAGAESVEIVFHRERTFPAAEVVARAYSRIADPALASMFRDSQAFAEWCTTGRLPVAPRNVAIGAPALSGRAATPPPIAPAAAARPKAKAAASAKPARAAPARGARAARPKKAKPARKATATKRAAKRKTAKRRARR
jgi:hypothetical protein